MTDPTEQIDPEQIMALYEFIKAYNSPLDVDLWQALVREEAIEVISADTPANRLKEVCDFAYVCTGLMVVAKETETTLEELRDIDPYTQIILEAAGAIAERVIDTVGPDKFDEAFRRVHISNMSKLGDDGKPIYREDGKVLKGPNYQPPVLEDLAMPSAESPRQLLN